jgi:hypothetical protein
MEPANGRCMMVLLIKSIIRRCVTPLFVVYYADPQPARK